jgi:hypothetical protein
VLLKAVFAEEHSLSAVAQFAIVKVASRRRAIVALADY